MSNSEYTAFEELGKLSDQELRDLVVRGVNLHIHTSQASIAKRILDTRLQNKQIKELNAATKQLKKSNKELFDLAGGLKEVVKLLNFFKTHWFPQQPVWIKVGMFLVGTIILGIALNLVSDAISKFIFHW